MSRIRTVKPDLFGSELGRWAGDAPFPVVRDIMGFRIPTLVYRFFDAGGDLLYVGVSAAFGQRCTQHRRKAPWWALIATLSITWYENGPLALAAERVAIRYERPVFNLRSKAVA